MIHSSCQYLINHFSLHRYQFNAGEIANVINQAAEMCAANGSGNAVLAHDQLVEAAELEVKRKDQRTTFIPSIFQ